MTSLLNWPPLPIPIPSRLRQPVPEAGADPQKYAHHLAVTAVASYLKMIAVPHRLEPSADSPRLYVEELGGYLGCCPVLPNASKCSVPSQEIAACQGFLFVELSPPYNCAQILGYVHQLTISELPLSYLQPLTAFTATLEASAQPALPRISLVTWSKESVPNWLSLQDILSQGLKGMLPRSQPAFTMRGASKQSQHHSLYERYATAQGDASLVRSLSAMEPTAALAEIVDHTTDDAILWQAAEQLAYESSDHPLVPVIRIKSLGDELGGLAVALLVGIISRPDNTFLVGCRLYATAETPDLPEDIMLRGIEETGTGTDNPVFCEIMPAVHGDPLEYLFTAEEGDQFSFQVHYQGMDFTNRFVLATEHIP